MATQTAESISDFVRRHQISIEAVKIGERPDKLMSDLPNHWSVTLKRGSHRFHIWFSGGSAIRNVNCEDILNCIQSDAIRGESFESWASDLGYDPDSRQALKVYRACERQTVKALNFLGQQAFDELLECEQL